MCFHEVVLEVLGWLPYSVARWTPSLFWSQVCTQLQEALEASSAKHVSVARSRGSALGSIGSEFKIDAAYLSPNVQVTSRLQRSTGNYGRRLRPHRQVRAALVVGPAIAPHGSWASWVLAEHR